MIWLIYKREKVIKPKLFRQLKDARKWVERNSVEVVDYAVPRQEVIDGWWKEEEGCKTE
jgi:hypothetical protein